MKVHRVSTRIKNVLVMVVAILLLGASSQAAVCELSCGLQMQASECAASMSGMSGMPMGESVAHAPGAGMDHSHCAHGMQATARQAVLHHLGECHDGGCSHVQVGAFDKSSGTSLSFAAVTWIAVALVPLDPGLTRNARRMAERPLFQSAAADPLVVSLRV